MIFSLNKRIYSCDQWEQKSLMPGIMSFHPIVLYTDSPCAKTTISCSGIIPSGLTYPLDVTLRHILLLGVHRSVLGVLIYDSNIFIFIQRQSKNENFNQFLLWRGPPWSLYDHTSLHSPWLSAWPHVARKFDIPRGNR